MSGSKPKGTSKNGHLRLVLFQAREPDDPMRLHEIDCFTRHMGIAEQDLEILSILHSEPAVLDELLLDPAVRVLIGGSGDYSISSGGPARLMRFVHEFIPRLVESKLPTLGSCWGLHALVAGLGGRVDYTGDSEVGTFDVHLVEHASDPLFAEMPTAFSAQMGHKDWVLEVPGDATPLCHNELSPYQALRFGEGPVYGLQFHAELDEHDNRSRFLHYISNYGSPDVDAEEQLARFRPSPHANTLLRRFYELYCRNGNGRPATGNGE